MTRSVRVLHLIAELGGGGSERWLRDVVRLSPSGFEHRIQTVYPSRLIDFRYAEELRGLGAYEHHPPRFVASPPTLRRLREVWARAPRCVHTAARAAAGGAAVWRTLPLVTRFQPDVIHSHTLLDLLVGLPVSRAKGIPLVHTVPCLFSQMRADGYGWMPAIYSRIHPWVDRFSAGDNRHELISVGVPAEKILYDLGGVDFDAVDAVLARRSLHAAEIRRSIGLPVGCPIALSVGRLHPSKGQLLGIRVLKELLAQVPELHLVMLGEGPDRASLSAAAAESGVADRVHFPGFMPDPLPYYAASDVYFRTSLLEMENLSSYAAMATGLPVVGFDTGQGRDLIQAVGCGLQVPAADQAAFVRAAAGLLAMDDRGRSLGERGRAYARDHLDLRTSVSLLSRVYRELAGTAAGPGDPEDPETDAARLEARPPR